MRQKVHYRRYILDISYISNIYLLYIFNISRNILTHILYFHGGRVAAVQNSVKARDTV